MAIHRPYSRIRGTEPSVTTILDLLPKPGLPWGASKETAMFAVLHQDKWGTLPDNEAIDKLRRHHRGIWDSRAAMGSFAHAVNDSLVLGEEVNLELLVEETIKNDPKAKTWADRNRDDLLEECLGYVLGIQKWWEDFRPRDVRSEIVVRWPGLFIGQTDMRADETLWDIKTTAKQDDGEGLYFDSWTLQLAAYGMARETVDYVLQEDRKLKSGQRVVESATGPWTRPKRYGVIHLRGDENYTPYEIPVTARDERTFLRLARAYPGLKAIPSKPSFFQPEVAA